MDYDDQDIEDVRPPIASFKEAIIPTNVENDDDNIDSIIKQSLLEYEEQLKKNMYSEPEPLSELEKIIQQSLLEYEEQMLRNEEQILQNEEQTNKSDIDIVIQQSLVEYENSLKSKNDIEEYVKTERLNKLSNFISQLKRIVSLQKNDLLSNLLNSIENYCKGTINDIPVNKDEYNKIFNEIKNIRHTSELLETLKSIIVISTDIKI